MRYLATGSAARRRRRLVGAGRRAPGAPPVALVDGRNSRCANAIAIRRPQSPTLVDDIGGWLTAAMDRRGAWTAGSVAADVDELIDAVGAFGSPLVLVSPEVGLTVVPRDGGGPAVRRRAGQRSTSGWPALCDRVVLVVAGQPVTVKEPSRAGSDRDGLPTITPPDAEVAAAARGPSGPLTKPPGALGRLEDLSVWVASCQGVCPPRQFEPAASGGVRR